MNPFDPIALRLARVERRTRHQSARYGARLAQGGFTPSILTKLRERPGKKPYPPPPAQAVSLMRRDLGSCTRDELRRLAKYHGVRRYGKMDKAQLIEAVIAKRMSR